MALPELKYMGAQDFPVLYTGPQFPVQTLEGRKPPRNTNVSVVVMAIEGDHIAFGYQVHTRSEVTKLRLAAVNGELLLAYRCALLLHGMPILDESKLDQSVQEMTGEGDGSMRRHVQAADYTQMAAAIPPRLEDTLLALFDARCRILRRPIVELIDAGLLKMSETLRMIGIEDPVLTRERERRQAQLLGRYQDVLDLFRGEYAHNHDAECRCEEGFKLMILECLRRNVGPRRLVATMSAYCYSQELPAVDEIPGMLSSLLGISKPGSQLTQKFRRRNRLLDRAVEFGLQVPSPEGPQTAEDLRSELIRLDRTWSTLEVNKAI